MLTSLNNRSIERETKMDELNPIGTQEQEAQGDVQTTTQDLPPVNQEEQGQEDFSLPETSNDRTKEQFNKLLQSNKELKEKLAQVESNRNSEPQIAYGSVYETFKSNPVVQPVADVQDTDYITADGEVDIEKLNADLKALKVSALEARRLAEQAREEIEVREAHIKHPYLDPQSPEFDPNFFELVKDRIIRQKYYEGKNSSLSNVADQVLSFYRPSSMSKKQAEKANEEFKKAQQQVASNTPLSSSTPRRQEVKNIDDLRARTQRGDSSALRERLKALGI
jgi:hypothetical protein